jgi:hypothetical protein
MNAFTRTTDVPTAAFPVLKQASSGADWANVLNAEGKIPATQAEAELLAATVVGPPDNNFAARVCTPSGDLFLHGT